MKWTTLLLLVSMLEVWSQNQIAFLQTVPATATPQVKVYAADTAIPLKIIHGLPFVKANLNGVSGNFMLDTGAPLLVVNQPNVLEHSTIAAASFSSNFNVGVLKIKNFAWANLQRKGLEALALDAQHLENFTGMPIAGLVGYDLIKAYEIYIDYPDQQLLLLPPGKNKLHVAAKPLLTLDLTLQDHLPVVMVEVNGQMLRLGLDTGAGINLIDKHLQADLSINLEAFLGEELVKSIDQSDHLRATLVIENTSLNKLQLGSMKYLFSDLTHLESTTSLKIDGLLGAPFFEKVKCSIDYPNRKLHIWSVTQ